MNFHSVTLYLHRKHLEAGVIPTEISRVLGQRTIEYSTVTRYLRKQSFADSSNAPPEKPEIKAPDTINSTILQALDRQPFASLCQFAKRILIPMAAAQDHFVNRAGYKLKHCKQGLHRPSDAQK
jgi:hypothetical protein